MSVVVDGAVAATVVSVVDVVADVVAASGSDELDVTVWVVATSEAVSAFARLTVAAPPAMAAITVEA